MINKLYNIDKNKMLSKNSSGLIKISLWNKAIRAL